MYECFVKRFLDFITALVALVLLSPLFIVISICLCVKGGKSAIFFFQDRPGRARVIFKVIKFKTMSDKRDESGRLLSDRQRLTKLGRFMRSTSIDELPQLINILKGNMSFIGPRPLLVDYLSLYSDEQNRRHNVRPGLSGWAQVNGRNDISWRQKLEYDIWYVDNISFMLDIKIMWMTVKKVLDREGVNAQGHSTTVRFTGNN